ncbi:MAG: TIGR01548 family HAD-type hydrolase [Bacteroidetes bacterium]|nr:MAG: TIGR01548 family HAD-type hydrolase [Bacteroidota bacterium]
MPDMNFTLPVFDRPNGLLFDIDGVLADVSQSYRQAILETAASFGVTIQPSDIDQLKRAGNANNDWILTYQLLIRNGIDVRYEEVVAQFQNVYLGSGDRAGFRETESLLVSDELIPRLAAIFSLGIVTGRPRKEADWFLDRYDLSSHFQTIVAMEDEAAKPDPAPVRRALCRLNISAAWMIGDTPDDIRAAIGAGIPAVGIDETGNQSVLLEAGALFVLSSANQIADILL